MNLYKKATALTIVVLTILFGLFFTFNAYAGEGTPRFEVKGYADGSYTLRWDQYKYNLYIAADPDPMPWKCNEPDPEPWRCETYTWDQLRIIANKTGYIDTPAQPIPVLQEIGDESNGGRIWLGPDGVVITVFVNPPPR